jgi:hypothetical protein
MKAAVSEYLRGEFLFVRRFFCFLEEGDICPKDAEREELRSFSDFALSSVFAVNLSLSESPPARRDLPLEVIF